MVKSFTAVVLLRVSEKNSVPPASGFALTVIETPVEGRLVMVILSGKLGPGDGACTELIAGEVVAEIAV